MTKEEIKQYLRNQINSSIKTQSIYNNNVYHLCYNKSYLRALKLSKITGHPVNKTDFKEGDQLFGVNSKTKKFTYYSKIMVYLNNNYSEDYSERIKLLEEVFKEYEEYKGYKFGWKYYE